MASEGAIAQVETYTTMAPVGAVSQEYKGMLVVSKVGKNRWREIGCSSNRLWIALLNTVSAVVWQIENSPEG